MAKSVLITGGAGFIGSHLADELLAAGYHVRALDSLVDQVHGGACRPDYLDDDVELLVGDVRDEAAVRRALEGVDAVVHLAARVGVGQSMYAIAEYAAANTVGTAVLLEALLDRPVEKLVVASSMSIYGEGSYVTTDRSPCTAVERTRAQLERGEWEPRGAQGERLLPVATSEEKQPVLASIYALTKYDQERMCLLFGSVYDVPTVALRFFNAYGPRQALSNPYTGVLAIFASRLLNGRRPQVFEDGRQRRDFVNVSDVVRAVRLALERPGADGRAVNVGSGQSVSISGIGQKLAIVLGSEIEPEVTGKLRVGDIRHCFADISSAQELLGYEPRTSLEEGMAELAEWLEGQVASDGFESASAELGARGLSR